MAEFRKREDITQELDILQHWSEMGAPRLDDLSRNLESLVNTIDPSLARDFRQAPSIEMMVSQTPPEFRNLPPGVDEEPHSRRRLMLPLLAALLLAGAGAAFLLSRWGSLLPEAMRSPSPEPTGEGMAALPSAAPSETPSPVPTPSPTAAPTATPSPAPSETPAPSATVPAGQMSEAPVAALPSVPELPRTHATPAPVVNATPKPVATPASEYVVVAGDSLYGIAKAHLGNGDRWNEIYEANRDTVSAPNLITPGTRLRLPGAAAPAAAPGGTYTVRRGDTLGRIAAKTLGSAKRWHEVYEVNRDRMSSPHVVLPGTQLRLPRGAAAVAQAPSGAAQPAVRAQSFVHVVQPGESLSLLAARFLGSSSRWADIYYMNTHQISNPHWIYPGQRLAIPKAASRPAVRYVVKVGDTLWTIAARTTGDGADWRSVYMANRGRIRNPHLIYPGQSLTIPR